MKTRWKKIILAVVLFSVFQSSLISISYANTCGLKNGIEVTLLHNISHYQFELETVLTFTKTTDEFYRVDWYWGGNFHDTGTWLTHIDTRVISGQETFGPENGGLCWSWIFTDVSIGENVTMYNYWRYHTVLEKHTNHTITGESTFESMEVWVLENEYGCVNLYEKTHGFLVNASCFYEDRWETFKFVKVVHPMIPGYSVPIIIVLAGIMSLILYRKVKTKK